MEKGDIEFEEYNISISINISISSIDLSEIKPFLQETHLDCSPVKANNEKKLGIDQNIKNKSCFFVLIFALFVVFSCQ